MRETETESERERDRQTDRQKDFEKETMVDWIDGMKERGVERYLTKER